MTSVESAPSGGAEHFGQAWPKLLQFADMIVREGEKRGLVGPANSSGYGRVTSSTRRPSWISSPRDHVLATSAQERDSPAWLSPFVGQTAR